MNRQRQLPKQKLLVYGSRLCVLALTGLGLFLVTPGVSLAQQKIPSTTTNNAPAAKSDWAGSHSLFGSSTRFRVGGFLELDLVHDSDATGAPCQFITATIPTSGGGGTGSQGNACINTSRLTVETRTPTTTGQFKTFISGDLFGDALSTSPSPRLRQAYGEFQGSVLGGDLLLGQAWGTYVDLEAWPDILDFEGPGSAIAVRQPMIRWSKGITDGVDLQLALEEPGEGSVQGATMLNNFPDLIGTIKWSPAAGHLRVGGILRDIRIRDNTGREDDAVGWGVSGSGKLKFNQSSNFVFEASYGEGVGAYYNDGPPNGVFDPVTSSYKNLPLLGYYLGLEHNWSKTLNSTLLYSAIKVDNLGLEPDNAFRKSNYSSLNLIWRPKNRLMFGIEYLHGERQDKNGAKGSDNRFLLSSRVSF